MRRAAAITRPIQCSVWTIRCKRCDAEGFCQQGFEATERRVSLGISLVRRSVQRPGRRRRFWAATLAALLLAFGLESLSYAAVAVSCTASPIKNKRFECAITGVVQTGLSGLGAYRDAKLKVTFTHAGIPYPYVTYAFWDGGEGTISSPATFRFRARLHDAGFWHWQTLCVAGPCSTMSGLGADTASVASPGALDPALYRQGPLTVIHLGYTATAGGITNYTRSLFLMGSYLTHYSGPFTWVGDSAWAAPMRGDLASWNAYLDSRVARGFTVIQIGPGPYWANKENSPSRQPFEQLPTTQCTFDPHLEEALPNVCSRARLEFWSKMDAFVEAANAKGLVIFLTGLMEPVGGPSDCDYNCGVPGFPPRPTTMLTRRAQRTPKKTAIQTTNRRRPSRAMSLPGWREITSSSRLVSMIFQFRTTTRRSPGAFTRTSLASSMRSARKSAPRRALMAGAGP